MALVTCTNCGAKLNTKNPMAPGKKVSCPKCKAIFVVQAEDAPQVAEEVAEVEVPPMVIKPVPTEEESFQEGAAPRAKTPAKPARAPVDEDEDPDERPRRRQRDEAPTDEEEPSRKMKLAKDLPRSRTPFLQIVGVVGLAIVCCVGTCLVGYAVGDFGGRPPRGRPMNFNNRGMPRDGNVGMGGGNLDDKEKVKEKDDDKDKDIDKNKPKDKPIVDIVPVAPAARALAKEEARKREEEWLTEVRKLPAPAQPGVLAVINDANARELFIAFSPTEPTIAVAAWGNVKQGITLRDLRTLKVLKTIPINLPLVDAMQFSPDGKLLAIATNEDKTLRVWDVVEGKVVKSFKFKGDPTDVEFTSDGAYLLTVNDLAATVRIFKTADWSEAAYRSPKNPVNHVLLPGGERILEQDKSNFQDERLIVTDLATGKRTNVKMPKGMATFGLGVSPDGRQFAWTATDDNTTNVILFDLDKEQTTSLVTAKKFAIGSASFTADGKHVAYQTNDGGQFLKFVNIADKKELATIPTTGSKITFSPGGVFWARATGNNVYLHAWEDLKK